MNNTNWKKHFDLLWDVSTNHISLSTAKEKIQELTSASSKEDAIAFGEWLDKNTYNQKWKPDGNLSNKYSKLLTTSELYDIYSADTNKEGV